MTFSDMQSFIKFSCHASIFKDILKEVPCPPNQGVNQERGRHRIQETGRKKNRILREGNLIQDRSKKDFLIDGGQKTPKSQLCVKAREQPDQPSASPGEIFFKEKTLIPRVEIALPAITCCVNLGQIVFLYAPVSPWRRKWQSTSAFLPGKFHGQGSLGGLQSMGLQRVGYDSATKQQTTTVSPSIK